MRRRVGLLAASLLLSVTLAPATAEADVIQCVTPSDPACVVIGEFFWSRDEFFFDDILGVNNLSSFTPFAGDFSAFTLDLTFAGGGTGTASLFDDPLAPGGATETTDFLFDVTTAALTFLFRDATFNVTLTDLDLVSDGFVSHGATLVYAQPQAIPEPSSLLLLGIGLAGARWATTRQP